MTAFILEATAFVQNSRQSEGDEDAGVLGVKSFVCVLLPLLVACAANGGGPLSLWQSRGIRAALQGLCRSV